MTQEYAASEHLRCPSCSTPQGVLGGQASVRINPKGRQAPPSPGWTYSWHCRKCHENIEIRMDQTEAA